MKFRIHTAFGALILTALCQNAHAESPWSLGGAVIANSPIYLGAEGRVLAFPSVSYKNEPFSLDVREGLVVDLVKASSDSGYFASLKAQISPQMAPNFGEDSRMDGMERDFSLNLGVKGSVGWAFTFIDFDAKADALGVHDGYQASVAAGIRQRLGKGGVMLKAGARLRDENYGRYLYGVYDDEARAARPSFTPKAVLTSFASLSVFYPLSEKVSLFGSLTYEDLSAYEDSPILENTEQTSFVMGASYSF